MHWFLSWMFCGCRRADCNYCSLKDKHFVPSSFYILQLLDSDSNLLCTFLINVFHSYRWLELVDKRIPVALSQHWALFVYWVKEFVFLIVAKLLMSPVTLKRPFPALIGPQSLYSYQRNHDFPDFIVVSRDVEIMSLCHPSLKAKHFQPFLCQILSEDLLQKHGGGS